MSQKEWQSPFPWDSPPQRFLKLPNPVMERICRFLPTQRDLYEVCLVHQSWSKAASDVLWEAPQFRDPVAFQSFLASATTHKRFALAVRTLCLVLRDEEQQTVFRPLVDSELPRHTKRDNVLTRRELIMHFAQQCEELRTLKIYGWQLNPSMVEAIGMVLTELESLTLVGSNPSFHGVFIQRNLLTRLKELRLDGDFVIDERFAEIISTRAQSLKSLQIPLIGMERKALIRLCSGNLNLEQITLTKARHMTDDDVHGVLQSFPNLRVFVLEGTYRVTANALLISLSACTYLKHVELRANEESLNQSTTEPPLFVPKRKITRHIHLRTLIVENFNLPGDIVSSLPALPHLTTIGLRNCMLIDDAMLINALAQTSRLTTIQLIYCAGLTEKVLQNLWEGHSKFTIREVHVERCGLIKPWTVYQLCCRCVRTLKLLRLIGYKNVSNSVLKDYALKNMDPDTMALNEQMIDALVNVDLGSSSDLMDLPKNRTLTGEQIVVLAKILNLSVAELDRAMERVQKETSTTGDDLGTTNVTRESVHLQNKHLSRVTSTNKCLGNQRSTTPALWAAANHSGIDEYLSNDVTEMAAANLQTTLLRTRPQHSVEFSANSIPLMEQAEGSSIESPMSQSLSPPSSTSPDRDMSPESEVEPKYDSGDLSKEPEESGSELENNAFADLDINAYEMGDNEFADSDNNAYEAADNEFADSDSNAYEVADNVHQEPDNAYETALSDEHAPTMEEWPSLTSTNLSSKTPEFNLGGWGSTSALPWAKKTSSAATSYLKSTSERPPPGQDWKPHTLDRHKHEWQQTALEAQVAKPVKRGVSNLHIKTLESEGWGTPKGYMPWNDLRQQGYAYDVLEKQKKTKFWDKSDGGWKVLNPDLPRSDPQTAVPQQPIVSAKLTAHPRQSIEKSSSTEHRRWEHSPQPMPSKGAEPRRSLSDAAALSSDDELINWDEDDGITIKTSPSQTPRTMYTKGPHKTPVPDQPKARQSAPTSRSGASRFEPPPGKLAGRWSEFKDIDVPPITDHRNGASSEHNNAFLVDTSDVVKQADDFEKDDNLLQTSLLDSTFWRDMSSLSAPMQEPLQPEPTRTQLQPRQPPPHGITSTGQDITTAPSPLPPVLVPTTTASPSNEDDTSTHSQDVAATPAGMMSSNMGNTILEEVLEPTVAGSPLLSSPPEPAPATPGVSTQPVELANESRLSPPPPSPLPPPHPATVPNPLHPDEDVESTVAETAPSPGAAAAAATSDIVADIPDTTTTTSAETPSPPKHKKLVSFRFELPNRSDLPPLQLYQDVKLEDSIAEYCKEHDIEDLTDHMNKVLKPRYTALHTRRVLNKANAVRKKKKRNEDAELL